MLNLFDFETEVVKGITLEINTYLNEKIDSNLNIYDYWKGQFIWQS